MYAFIHIPKAGGSTLSTILRRSFLSRHCDLKLRDGFYYPVLTAAALRRAHWIYWRLESIAGHYVAPHVDLESYWPDVRYYTFLRDPVRRCISEYQRAIDRLKSRMPFDQWIADPLTRNRITKHLAGCEDAERAIDVLESRVGMVGLVERFDESLLLLRHWMDDPRLDIRYRAKNVARRNVIKKQLLGDPRAMQRLADANQLDLRVYRHVVEQIYPRQVARYGPRLAEDVAHFRRTNIPPPKYPRQLPSLLLREMVFRPLAPVVKRVCLPPLRTTRAA
jgi:Galactose-3-O-sulfotransferase